MDGCRPNAKKEYDRAGGRADTREAADEPAAAECHGSRTLSIGRETDALVFGRFPTAVQRSREFNRQTGRQSADAERTLLPTSTLGHGSAAGPRTPGRRRRRTGGRGTDLD